MKNIKKFIAFTLWETICIIIFLAVIMSSKITYVNSVNEDAKLQGATIDDKLRTIVIGERFKTIEDNSPLEYRENIREIGKDLRRLSSAMYNNNSSERGNLYLWAANSCTLASFCIILFLCELGIAVLVGIVVVLIIVLTVKKNPEKLEGLEPPKIGGHMIDFAILLCMSFYIPSVITNWATSKILGTDQAYNIIPSFSILMPVLFAIAMVVISHIGSKVICNIIERREE